MCGQWRSPVGHCLKACSGSQWPSLDSSHVIGCLIAQRMRPILGARLLAGCGNVKAADPSVGASGLVGHLAARRRSASRLLWQAGVRSSAWR